jgi:UDPglucose 6-dehydrogenase
MLAGEGSAVRAYDPMADLRELPAGFPADVRGDPYETARGSDALLILTGWPEFARVDYASIRRSMRHPVVIDALNMLDRDEMQGYGFHYLGTGR